MANDNTFLQVASGAFSATSSTTNAQAFLNAAGVAASLSMPANSNVDGRPFAVRYCGTVKNLNATSVTILPSIYLGTITTTTAGNTAIILPSAVSSHLASVVGMNWIIDAEFLWDSVSGSLNGNYLVQIGPGATSTGFVTSTKSTSVTSGLTLGGAGTLGLNFVPFFAYSASSTNNTAVLTEFSLSNV